MSYTKEQLSSLATSRGRDNKLQSLDSVFKAIRQVRDRVAAEFFEIEAFEVLEVNIDPEKPSFPKKQGFFFYFFDIFSTPNKPEICVFYLKM